MQNYFPKNRTLAKKNAANNEGVYFREITSLK